MRKSSIARNSYDNLEISFQITKARYRKTRNLTAMRTITMDKKKIVVSTVSSMSFKIFQSKFL